MTINKLFIPQNLTNSYTGQTLTAIRGIIIHNTDNFSPDATAHAHAKLQARGYCPGGVKTSWHYSVDDTEIWQSIPDLHKTYSTGSANANNYNITIEICVNNPDRFREACLNAAELCAYLLKKYSLPITSVSQHFEHTKKNCPSILRSCQWKISWQDFLNFISEKSDFIMSDNNLNLEQAIGIFVEKGIISSPDYWFKASDIVLNLDALLLKTAKKLSEND